MKSNIWVEKYRPKSVAEVIFQDDRQQKQFQSFLDSGDIPHLFLSGVQGTGKTSISQAIVKDLKVDPSDVMRINCSDEKIDAMRSKVTSFAMTMPLGKFKVVRLEEIDYLSLDAQALLRSVIEETQGSCRFIATCNYANKIIPPLKSRFQEFYFRAPDKDKVALRMAEILETESIDFDPEHLLTYVDVGYPDIRKTIQLLQGNIQDGVLLNPSQVSSSGADWKFGLLEAISTGNFKLARKLVCESATKEEHEDVYRFLYENISKLKVNDRDEAVLTIAEFLYKHSIVADTEINLAALFIQLSKL
jgi:DNA polymerase III delta prime subunit